MRKVFAPCFRSRSARLRAAKIQVGLEPLQAYRLSFSTFLNAVLPYRFPAVSPAGQRGVPRLRVAKIRCSRAPLQGKSAREPIFFCASADRWPGGVEDGYILLSTSLGTLLLPVSPTLLLKIFFGHLRPRHLVEKRETRKEKGRVNPSSKLASWQSVAWVRWRSRRKARLVVLYPFFFSIIHPAPPPRQTLARRWRCP